MKYTKEKISEAVQNSNTWRSAMRYLNPLDKGNGASQAHLKSKAIEYGIDYSHFLGAGWSKGKSLAPRKPIENYLVISEVGTKCCSNFLKRKLISSGLKPKHCEMCKLSEWNGQPIHVELHHINCNRRDNRIENLTILCSNCHSFIHGKIGHTPKKHGWAHRNKKNHEARKNTLNPSGKTCECGNPLKVNQKKYCSYDCSYKASKKYVRPSKEELMGLVSSISMLKIAERFGATDNLIRSWCKDYEIDFLQLSPFSYLNKKAAVRKAKRVFPSKYLYVSIDNKRNKWFVKIKRLNIVKRFDDELSAAKFVSEVLGEKDLVLRKGNVDTV